MSIDDQILSAPTQKTKPEDDAEWEDIPDTNRARDESDGSAEPRASYVRSGTPGTPRSATRRRKPTKTVFLAQPQPTPRRFSQVSQPQKARKKVFDIDTDQVQDALAQSAASSVRYFGSVLTHAFQLLKKPLGFLLFLYFLGILLGWLFTRFHAAFAPICWIPGISRTALCRVHHQIPEGVAKPPKRVDYPRLVEIQSSSFEHLLDGTVGGPALTLDIKQAEMATRDLITLVRHSKLTSRDLLAESLWEFVADAKKAGRGLQRLTSRINGAVDKIMAVNDYALNTIEGAQAQPNSLMRIVWPFGAEPPSHAVALDVFQKSMEVHASEMQRLILEVEFSSANLDALEEDLSTIHDICTRENIDMGAARDALLADLWTVLGGNRARVRVFNTNLELLRELGEYRKRAAAHVTAAMQTLHAMGEDMEDLRDRVAAPEIAGDQVPMEVHMKSIRAGMERLKEQRVKAKEREETLMKRVLGVED